MNKAHVTDLLSDFVEGGLSYASAEKVKAHLAFCNRCRQELEEIKHQRAVLRTTPEATPPAGLEGRVLAAVRHEREHERMPVQTGSGKFVWPSWFTPMRGLALAATCGIVVVVVRNLPRNAVSQRSTEAARALSKERGEAPVAIANRGTSSAENAAGADQAGTAPTPVAAAGNRSSASQSGAKPVTEPMTAAPAIPPVAPPAAALQQAQTAAAAEAAADRVDAPSEAKVVPLPGVRKKAHAAEAARMMAADTESAAAPPPEAVPLMEGSQSAIGTPRELVVKDAAVWRALWKEHMSRVPNPPPAPDVDFVHNDVIAIFAGERPTGGYRVVIDDIGKTTWNGDTARVVRYHVAGPPAGVVAAQVISYPYLFTIQPHFSGETFFQKNR